MDANGIIDRAKLLTNVASDVALSRLLGKFDSYIGQCRIRKTVDVDLFLSVLNNADFNWLIVNNPYKERKVVKINNNHTTDTVDLNDVEISKDKKIQELEEKVKLLEMLLKELQEKNKR